MKKDFISVRPSGSTKKREPKVIGEVLSEYFKSNEPLAVVFCNTNAKGDATDADEEDDRLFRDLHPDTHLGIDLKILSRKAGRMRVGEYINCLLTRDGEDHFEAVEDALKKQVAERRNPIIFRGMRINVHSKKDGTLYPTFNRPLFTDFYTFRDFCREAAEELLVVAGLVGKERK